MKVSFRISAVLVALMIVLTPFNTRAQGLAEDATILFMKANVLYESQRYDEAVRMYNRILNSDKNFVNAYVMRAKSKYALAAYRGTKDDLMSYIERAGITKEVVHLMMNAEQQLNNLTAAYNYAKVAIEMDPYSPELYRTAGEIAIADGMKNEACEHFAIGSSLGDKRSSDAFAKHCGSYMIKPTTTATASTETKDGEVLSSQTTKEEDIPAVEVVKKETVNRDAKQEINIDESLDIVITNGLGERKVEDQPDIFMISSDSGKITVDICVNNEGKVTEAKINRAESTLDSSSLRSLAMRKARGFMFMPSLSAEQCGTMVFMIKA